MYGYTEDRPHQVLENGPTCHHNAYFYKMAIHYQKNAPTGMGLLSFLPVAWHVRYKIFQIQGQRQRVLHFQHSNLGVCLG